MKTNSVQFNESHDAPDFSRLNPCEDEGKPARARSVTTAARSKTKRAKAKAAKPEPVAPVAPAATDKE